MLHKKKKGYTLIELLLALAVIAIILVSVFFIFSKVSLNMKTNELIREINSISSQVLNSNIENSAEDRNGNPGQKFDHSIIVTSLKEVNAEPNDIGNQLTVPYWTPFGNLMEGQFEEVIVKNTIVLKNYNIKILSITEPSVCVKLINSQINRDAFVKVTFSGGKSIEKSENGRKDDIMKEITKVCDQKYVTPTFYYE